MPKIKAGILYSGPSVIDGSPVVVIAIGGQSKNSKTGAVVQTYVVRADIDPITANRTGADRAICGDCVHRGKPSDKPTGNAEGRSCYVNLGQGPLQVFRAYQRGAYRVLTADEAKALGAGRMVRLGSYGDPQAVPPRVWDALLEDAAGHTGYTHQGAGDNRLMMSADSQEEAQGYQRQGLRTFRVIPVGEWKAYGHAAVAPDEILCPASAEAGKRSTCAKCRICNGSGPEARTSKSVAIVAHGTTRGRFTGEARV